jgi:sulfatase modifying factor 1
MMMVSMKTCAAACAALVLAGCQGAKEEEAGDFPVEDGMVALPGGAYQMGSSGSFDTPYGMKEFPEEAPVRTITVKAFSIDRTEVTNDQFAAFVKATGYVTFAERPARLEDFPPEARESLPQGGFSQGSLVFTKPAGSVGDPNTADAGSWWRWDPEANWRHPSGKASSIDGLGSHPVVCVNHEDAAAYAKWAGKRLPTEAEWEYAARGGLSGKIYAWGDEMKPGDKWMANTFQGEFPAGDSAADGYTSTAPVGTFPANGYGLRDMAGNVWELCSDYYDPAYPTYCAKENPAGPETWLNRTTGAKKSGPPHHVTKGGSYLCHVSYCMRYRPAARHSLEEDSPANHTGFRCVKD